MRNKSDRDNEMTHHAGKVFRAEKTTRNRDDFKVLMLGLMFGIIMLLTFPLFQRGYDASFTERPFIRATVEIIQTNDYERPMILYDADAVKIVEATWIAVIRDDKNQRMETRRGQGNYSPVEDNPYLWTWTAFFDNGDGAPPPTVPDRPFKVCVSYIAITIDTKVSDESPEVCSTVFNPNLDHTKIITHPGDKAP